MDDKVTVYQDRHGRWRWRLTAPNGLVIADSGQSYATAGNARRAWQRVVIGAHRAHLTTHRPRPLRKDHAA